MPIETVEFKGQLYPKFQTEGFAARFAFPFASEVCKGVGVDVGCNRIEWSLPGSIPVDPAIDDRFHATNFPQKELDYVFSSHCLEHVPNWTEALDYWIDSLKFGGVLFLYLPDYSQKYWRPWNNRKHIHSFRPEMIRDFLEDHPNIRNLFVSGVDAYNSFTCFAQKCPDR
jgi:SAM-dependent methyltransferase